MAFPRDLHDCNYDTDPRVNANLAQSLKGQNVVVCGAGRGVGRAISEMLCHASAASITCLALEKEKTKSAALDVTDFIAVEKILKEVVKEFGGVDFLAMNAGRPAQWLPTASSDPKIWWDTVSVSLQGAFVCTRAVLPIMKEQRRGRIVYTSSSGAHFSSGMGSYVVGKLGQVRLAEIVHAENGEYNIKCFAFNPGSIKTRFYLDFEDKVKQRPAREGSYVSDDSALEQESAETAYGILKDQTFDTPYMAGGLVTALASGRLDFMSGRYLDTAVDINKYLDMQDDIVNKDLCRVRLNLGNDELIPRLAC